MCGFLSVIGPQPRRAHEPIVVISRRLRNRWEARIHSLKARISYPRGKQPSALPDQLTGLVPLVAGRDSRYA
jgi:hypothetical protein